MSKSKSHRSKAYSELEREIIKEYLTQGKGYDEICQRLNEIGYQRSRDSISCHVRQHRIQYGYPEVYLSNFTKEEDEIILTMAAEGKSSLDIAEHISGRGHVVTQKQIQNHYETLHRRYPDVVFKNNHNFNRRDKFIEKACTAYCKCCDTKECENYGTANCDWLDKFRKAIEEQL